MPRKSRAAKSSPSASSFEAQARAVLEQEPELSPIGRDANGRFARGNAGGPGNPHARHCARMLAMFRNLIDDDKMIALMEVVYQMASSGDLGALKLIFSYKIGKPGKAPEPDGIERDEWNRFEETALSPKELQDLLTALPSSVANDIVRGTWPVAAGAWADNLGRQLQEAGAADAAVASDSDPVAAEAKNTETPAHVTSQDRDEQLKKYEDFMDQQIFGAPLPNGDLKGRPTGESGVPTSHAARRSTPATASTPLPNAVAQEVPASRKPSSSSKKAPIPNRKSKDPRIGKEAVDPSPTTHRSSPASAASAASKPKKKARRPWIDEVARRINK